MKLNYTTIFHEARKKLDLTMNEYATADLIYNLQNNPKSLVPGWCYASKKTIGEIMDINEKNIRNIVEKLIIKDLIEKNSQTKHLRTTQKWYNEVVITHAGDSPEGRVIRPSDAGDSPVEDAGDSPYNNNKDKNNNTISVLFDFYKEKSNTTKTKLTPERRRKIHTRLESYSEEELKQAITNCYQHPFYKGENDRGWKADIDYIFRSDEIIEKLLNLKILGKPAPYSQKPEVPQWQIDQNEQFLKELREEDAARRLLEQKSKEWQQKHKSQ